MSTITISARATTPAAQPVDSLAPNSSAPDTPADAPAHLRRALDHIFHRTDLCRTEHRAIVEITHSVARAVFEVVAGYRSVSQLAFVMEPTCIAKLQRRALLETGQYSVEPEPGTAHGQILSLHLDHCFSGAWECTAILGFKNRVRAVALKIEPWHGRWQVTDVELI